MKKSKKKMLKKKLKKIRDMYKIILNRNFWNKDLDMITEVFPAFIYTLLLNVTWIYDLFVTLYIVSI